MFPSMICTGIVGVSGSGVIHTVDAKIKDPRVHSSLHTMFHRHRSNGVHTDRHPSEVIYCCYFDYLNIKIFSNIVLR